MSHSVVVHVQRGRADMAMGVHMDKDRAPAVAFRTESIDKPTTF